jgi:hypothetical protein
LASPKTPNKWPPVSSAEVAEMEDGEEMFVASKTINHNNWAF